MKGESDMCKRKLNKFEAEQWLKHAALTRAKMKTQKIHMSPPKPDNLSADLMNKVILFLEGF